MMDIQTINTTAGCTGSKASSTSFVAKKRLAIAIISLPINRKYVAIKTRSLSLVMPDGRSLLPIFGVQLS